LPAAVFILAAVQAAVHQLQRHLYELAVYVLGGLIVLHSHLPTAGLDVIGPSIGWLAALLAALVCLAQPAEHTPKMSWSPHARDEQVHLVTTQAAQNLG